MSPAKDRAFRNRILRELRRTPGGLDGLTIHYDKNGAPHARGGKVFPARTAPTEIITPKKPKETKTMNELVIRGEYKGNAMLILKSSADDRFPFQFGLKKARLILEHLEAIREFVAEAERTQKAA